MTNEESPAQEERHIAGEEKAKKETEEVQGEEGQEEPQNLVEVSTAFSNLQKFESMAPRANIFMNRGIFKVSCLFTSTSVMKGVKASKASWAAVMSSFCSRSRLDRAESSAWRENSTSIL